MTSLAAFDDELRRPKAAAGPIHESYETLVHDWTDDSGEPGDKYDPELETLFREASPGVELDPELMQEFVDKLVAREPEAGALSDKRYGRHRYYAAPVPDLLGQSRTDEDDPREKSKSSGSATTVQSRRLRNSIISVAVTDQITGRQTEAISTTIAVALGILAIFFWLTLRQPALGFIAVGPIVLVLFSVLGTMALLGIPYTLVTSIITAVIDRHRGGLYHPRDSSLPRGVCSRPQPGESGDPDPRYDRFGVVGLCAHDGVWIRSADSLAAAGFTAVRHHCDHYDRLLPDSLGLCGSACNGGLGGVPEHGGCAPW